MENVSNPVFLDFFTFSPTGHLVWFFVVIYENNMGHVLCGPVFQIYKSEVGQQNCDVLPRNSLPYVDLQLFKHKKSNHPSLVFDWVWESPSRTEVTG